MTTLNPIPTTAPGLSAAGASPGTGTGASLRLAYLTTEYPAISHSFIRRELKEIERRGHSIVRISIRRARQVPVDPEDRAELDRTVVVLDHSILAFVAAAFRTLLTRPAAVLRTFRTAMQMARQAGGSWPRHLVYLLEAMLLLHVLDSRGVRHVHVHFGHNATTVARLVHRLGGPTYSFTVHGIETLDAPRQHSLGEKVHDASFAVGISDYGAAQIRRWTRYADWPKVHVVRCGIESGFFDAVTPVPEGSREIVCVGRLSSEKAPSVLIEAFALLRASGIDGRLVLVGDGPMRSDLEQLVRDLGIADHVEFAGWATEAQVRERMARARVAVLPSFMEGLPVVLLEAMAMGRPVIASRLTGIPEIVRPGQTGWLVTVGRADELAAAMREAMLTPADRLTEMGERGRSLVAERHTVRGEGDRMEALLRRYVPTALGPARTDMGT